MWQFNRYIHFFFIFLLIKINGKGVLGGNCDYAISPECYMGISIFIPRAPVIIEYYQFVGEPLDGKMI